MRILLAEDEQSVSRLIEKVLASAGYDVVGVRSCAEAISWLEVDGFNLVLLDLHLADGDGFSVVEALEGMAEVATPIVVMTGEGDFEEDPRACRVSGVLKKPFGLDELESMVERYCA
jgi:DNA-binding response OmpR family regulator